MSERTQALELRPPPNGSEPTSMLALIERIATDPSLPIERLERLLDMQERISAKQAETDFAVSMSAAQSEMAPITTDEKNTHTGSKYATYAQLDRALRPIYTKHGFALSFDEAESPKAGHIRVICHVSHRGGHTRVYHRDMPVVTTGIAGNAMMTETHGNASAQSYAMRYLLKGVFNVAIAEDDDDGNGDPTDFITTDQATIINDKIVEAKTDKGQFLVWIKAGAVEEIAAKNYERAIKKLDSIIAKKKAK